MKNENTQIQTGTLNENMFAYKSANEIKLEWNDQYPIVTFERDRKFFIVRSPKGVELERYAHVPTLGWFLTYSKRITDMKNENKKGRSTPLIIGTPNFISVQAAVKYYAKYSETADDVQEKIETKTIYIGKPKLRNETDALDIDEDGRYLIIEAGRLRSGLE